MLSMLHFGTLVVSLFKSHRRLQVENLFLRHQLNIALRHAPQRLRLHGSDRALLTWMTWLWPSLLGSARVVQPDTPFAGIEQGFGPIGAGNRAVTLAGLKLAVTCVILLLDAMSSTGTLCRRRHSADVFRLPRF
jgi:hypothetical protein